MARGEMPSDRALPTAAEVRALMAGAAEGNAQAAMQFVRTQLLPAIGATLRSATLAWNDVGDIWVRGSQTGVDVSTRDDPRWVPVLLGVMRTDYPGFRVTLLGVSYGSGSPRGLPPPPEVRTLNAQDPVAAIREYRKFRANGHIRVRIEA